MQTIKMSKVQLDEILRSDGLRWLGLSTISKHVSKRADREKFDPQRPMSYALSEWTNTCGWCCGTMGYTKCRCES